MHSGICARRFASRDFALGPTPLSAQVSRRQLFLLAGVAAGMSAGVCVRLIRLQIASSLAHSRNAQFLARCCHAVTPDARAASLIQQLASAVPLPSKARAMRSARTHETPAPPPLQRQRSRGVPPPQVFVAGATGETGRRVVEQLRAAGVTTVAGVRSIDKAKARSLRRPEEIRRSYASSLAKVLPHQIPTSTIRRPQKLGLDSKGATLVKADVTAGADALAAAIGDADAVVCCIGFAPSFNLGVDNPTKVDGQGTISLVDAAKKAGVKKFVMARTQRLRARGRSLLLR